MDGQKVYGILGLIEKECTHEEIELIRRKLAIIRDRKYRKETELLLDEQYKKCGELFVWLRKERGHRRE